MLWYNYWSYRSLGSYLAQRWTSIPRSDQTVLFLIKKIWTQCCRQHSLCYHVPTEIDTCGKCILQCYGVQVWHVREHIYITHSSTVCHEYTGHRAVTWICCTDGAALLTMAARRRAISAVIDFEINFKIRFRFLYKKKTKNAFTKNAPIPV